MRDARTPGIRDYTIAAAAFAVCVLTRLPFTSKLLYNMDSVQFALGMDRFDVTVHQPQPPGYYLYVLMGRLARLVMGTSDANAALVAVSILFGGLAAALVYVLAYRVFGRGTAIIATIIAITSPLFWFHGEVALSYMPEAFMSLAVAYLCYRVLEGEHGLFWASAVALAIAGGIRQNTMVFLMPLWLYSMKDLGYKRAIAGLFIFGAAVLAWMAPMVMATGGLVNYRAALDAHWNDSNWRGIHLDWILFNARYMSYFILSGLTVAVVPLAEYFIRGIAGHASDGMDRYTAYFFVLWLAPAFLFHLIIFTHPAVPGHSLIYMVGLVILSARAVLYVATRLSGMGGIMEPERASAIITAVIAVINTALFLFAPYPLSARSIHDHDETLTRYINAIREDFSPGDTEIIGSDRFIFSYRHIMYYLPRFKVFDTFYLTTPDGPRTLWGQDRDTHKTRFITLSPSTKRVIDFMNYDSADRTDIPEGVKLVDIGDGSLLAYYDDLSRLKDSGRIAPFLPPVPEGQK